MSSHSRYVNNMKARSLLEEHFPNPPLTVACNSAKCGEFNMLRCVREVGHEGPHNYVVDHANDYAHNKAKKK